MSNNPEQETSYDSTEEVEIEVTESENSDDEYAKDHNSDKGSDTESRRSGRKNEVSTPGKVKPSEKVKNMKMSSPESTNSTVAKSTKAKTFTPHKNPFGTWGDWNKESLAEITIDVPTLTARDETTNELTRANHPENRYWKSVITFKYNSFVSDTIRVENVGIPYLDSKNYGSSFVHLSLPKQLGHAISTAGKTKRPTIVNEKTLMDDPDTWWKTANKVNGVFGVLKPETNRFHHVSIEAILSSSNMGIMCSAVLKFYFKANTLGEPIKPTTQGTVAVELVRAYITDVNVDVPKPVKVSREKVTKEPVAARSDMASDAVLKKLAELGM